MSGYRRASRMETSRNHQAPRGLNSCPAEILQSVFNLLSATECRALCLVNQNLRAHAEPFLYSKIQWTWREVHTPPPIAEFLRTVINRPHLASYIKSIRLDGKCFSRGAYRLSIPPIPISESGMKLDELIAFIWKTGLPYSDFWIRALCKGITDAFVALLLAQPSNLRYLYLGPAFTQRSELIGMVLRSALCRPTDNRLPRFRFLEDVSVHLQMYEDQARDKKIKNTADVLPLFYLPNLKRMSVSIENPSIFSWPTSHPPDPAHLTSLDLTCIREAYLGDVLLATESLHTLRWKWYYDFGLHDEFNKPIVDLDQVGAALSRVSATLTDLCIVAEIGIGGNDQFLPAIKTKGSLHALVNLNKVRRVQVPWAFLVGFEQDTSKRLLDVVPKNVEFLTITYDLRLQNYDQMEPAWPEWEWEDHAILSLLQSWLQDWKRFTPRLRGISLEWIDDGFDEWNPNMRHQLREVGAKAGVQLDIVVISSM